MNFSKHDISICRTDGTKKYIYDEIRQREVLCTPEEIVRQQVLRYLIEELEVPKHMLDEEVALTYYKIDSVRRPDILILKKDESKGDAVPLAVIECKRKGTFITKEIVEQTLFYADNLECDYAMITDGVITDVAYFDSETGKYVSIEKLPKYQDMLKGKLS